MRNPSRKQSKYFNVLILLFIIVLSSCQNNTNEIQKDSTFNRVINTKTIKSGYVIYPPGSIKDPNSGKMSGIFIETLEQVGKNLGLKVEWTEEVGWGTMIEGLKSNRYDIIGSPVWANSSRAKHADFSIPLFYSGIGVIVRSGDNRFINDYSLLNDPKIKIATIDGEMSSIIVNSLFPKAEQISLTQMSDVSQLMLNVYNKKADATFVEPFYANQFLLMNPNSIKNVAKDNPVRIFPNVMMFNQGETRFKVMINTAIAELINSGFVDNLINKYQNNPNELYKVAKPYRVDE